MVLKKLRAAGNWPQYSTKYNGLFQETSFGNIQEPRTLIKQMQLLLKAVYNKI